MTRAAAIPQGQWVPALLSQDTIRVVMIYLLVNDVALSQQIARESRLTSEQVSLSLSSLYLANWVQCVGGSSGPVWRLTVMGRKRLVAWFLDQCERGIHV